MILDEDFEKGRIEKLYADIIETSMSYNLLKSRTFWTLVVTFLVNGYAAVSGQVPGNLDVVINLVLTALASYFHQSAGQSTTGTN